MAGGARPARVEEAGPDPPQLGPASLPGQVWLAEEDGEMTLWSAAPGGPVAMEASAQW